MTVSVTSLVVPMASFGNQRTPLPSGVLAGEIPADGFEGRPGLVIFDLDGRRVEVIAEAGYGRNDVGLVTEGIRAAGEPTRFETWPERPVS
jgi:hypothetical protein